MALITCPECGQQVSDKATNCPKCAYPLADMRTDGTVRIKMAVIAKQSGMNQPRQKITVFRDGLTVWEGIAGQIAEIYFEKPAQITVQYHTSALVWGAECSGEINPAKGKKYAVQKIPGYFKNGISLHQVDYIDSD